MPLPTKSLFSYGFVALCVMLSAAVMIYFFRSLPPVEGTSLGIDWKILWPDIQNGQLNYGDQLRIPPWDALLVLPLGLLSMRDSWALLTLFTLSILIASVPQMRNKRRLYWVSVFLLVTSYLSLRHLIDGNFEAIVISGILLFLYAYRTQNPLYGAIGLLLASAKPQETWLFLIACGFLVIRTWPRRKQVTLTAIIAVVVLPCLIWVGRLWLTSMGAILERGSLVDISLSATFGRLGLPSIAFAIAMLIFSGATIYLIAKTKPILSREKAAFLLCASMLLAPYTAGNSFLTIVTIGIIPLWLVKPRIGGILLVLSDLLFFAPADFLYYYSGYYWTAMLLITWIIMGWYVYRSDMIARTRSAKLVTPNLLPAS